MIFHLDKVKLWCGAGKMTRRLIKAKVKAKARTLLLREQREMEAETDEGGGDR